MDLSLLTKLAIEAAQTAGTIIQQYASEDLVVEKKEGGNSYASQVLTIVDKKCEAAIISHLSPTCAAYDIALLSEETKDDGSRFKSDYFWCIDPMDGTLAFINKQPGFSVSIALVATDGTPQIGVVYDPSTKTMYHATRGQGAFKNGTPWIIQNTNDYLTYVTDKQLKDTPQVSKIRDLLAEKAKQLSLKEIREMSGAGAVMNAILVLENGPACMIKHPKIESGGGSNWDYAATVCIYNELGLPATNYNGGWLDLNNRASTFMNEAGVLFASFSKVKKE